MVTDLKPCSTITAEIIGPAGAGKTTLLSLLGDRSLQIQPVFEYRRLSHIPACVAASVAMLPFFWRQFRDHVPHSWVEMRRMSRLNASTYLFKRRPTTQRSAVIIDQGPVFMLGRLLVDGTESTKTTRFDTWWHEMLARTAADLDMIIWLDAPEDVLLQRIRSRNKEHALKHQSQEDGVESIGRFRLAFEDVISAFGDHQGPTVLRFDTSEQSLDQITDTILTACMLGPVTSC